jgi:hypothetical protein
MHEVVTHQITDHVKSASSKTKSKIKNVLSEDKKEDKTKQDKEE